MIDRYCLFDGMARCIRVSNTNRYRMQNKCDLGKLCVKESKGFFVIEQVSFRDCLSPMKGS